MRSIHAAHALFPILAVIALAGCSTPPQPEPTAAPAPTLMTGDFTTPEESTLIIAGAFTDDSGCVALSGEENDSYPTLFVPGTKVVDDALLSFPNGEYFDLDEEFPGVVGMLVDAASVAPSVAGYDACVTASTDQVFVIARAPNLISPFVIGQ